MADQSRQRDDRMQQDGEQGGPDDQAPSFWEWVLAGAGLLLLLASVGYLLYYQWRSDDAPPDPAIEVVAIHQQQGRFLVRVRVRNRSHATAAALRVSGELRQGEAVVERSETEFPYLAAESSHEGGLFFTHDPRTLRLELAAESYQVP
jgi:uncharacterized protein (TIGR02588 family)